MVKPTLLSGLDLIAPDLPSGLVRFEAPPALASLGDLGDSIGKALEQPLGSVPLSARLGRDARVLIVFDDPFESGPVPARPIWGTTLNALVDAISVRLHPKRIRLLCANGLGRRPGSEELRNLLGEALFNRFNIETHNAEAHQGFFRLGTEGVELELDQALAECELVVHVQVVQRPTPPLRGLIEGLGTYRSLKSLHRPGHGLVERRAWFAQRAEIVRRALPLFSVAVVQSSALFTPTLGAVLRGAGGLSRAERTWNRLPYRVRQRTANVWRSEARPIAVLAGEPMAVAAQLETTLARQLRPTQVHNVDVLVVPVPDLALSGVGAHTNPVLAAHMGMWTLLGMARGLVRSGGAVILCNPLRESFDRTAHLPYVEFYERVLRFTSVGSELEQRFESSFGGRPELVAAYEKRGAVHGAHPFHRLYELELARRNLGAVIVAGAGAATAQRLGLDAAEDVASALQRASEAVGMESPQVGLLGLLPPWVE